MGTCCSKSQPEIQKDEEKMKIPLPFKEQDSIAVIGAGAGGLHMASLLIKRGYKNITVFEKEDRVGGKADTFVCSGGEHLETGTVLTYTDDHVVDLLKETQMYEHTRPLDTQDTTSYLHKLDRCVDKVDLVKELTGTNNVVYLKLKLLIEIRRFNKLYKDIVDEFGFPKKEFKDELLKPIDQFLLDNGMPTLIPLVHVRLISQGYDRGAISAYTAMFFLDPKYLTNRHGVLQFASGAGWQQVWRNLTSLHNINVVHDTKVTQVHEMDDGSLKISAENVNTGFAMEKDFKFCIIDVPNAADLISSNDGMTEKKKLLEEISNHAPVFTGHYRIDKDFPVNIIFDVTSTFLGQHYISACFYAKKDAPTLIMAYVYANYNECFAEKKVDEIENHLIEHLEYITKAKVVERIHWKINNQYLPHTSLDAIKEDIPWKLFEEQGNHNIWVTGASVCFDLTQAIIHYNEKILAKYEFAPSSNFRAGFSSIFQVVTNSVGLLNNVV